MSKGKVVTGNTTNKYYDVVEGEQYTMIKTFWYNGEGWVKVKDSKGNIIEIPDMMLDNVY